MVRQVFEDYQAGMSYRRIAESLTAQGIPYMDNRTDWNKHMVKRMLENFRYCGIDDFPQIILADTFEAVATLIGQKSQGKPLSEEMMCILIARSLNPFLWWMLVFLYFSIIMKACLVHMTILWYDELKSSHITQETGN